MIPVILIITVAIIVFGTVYLANGLGNIKVYAVASTIISVFVLWLTFGLWGYDEDYSRGHQVPCEDIYSLSMTSEISGTFVLGFGSLGSNMNYTYYTKDSSGLYRLSTRDATRTPMKLDDSQSPKIVKVVTIITKTPCTIFGGVASINEYDTGNRILVVPSTTIKQEYKVN